MTSGPASHDTISKGKGMSFRDITTDCMSNSERKQVLWIRIGFNADPDLALYLNEDPDPDPTKEPNKCGCTLHAFPNPGQTLPSLKVEFLHETYT